MDYINLFKENRIGDNAAYPHNDISTARLFYDLHSAAICYVVESKTWYIYTGKGSCAAVSKSNMTALWAT